MGVENCPIPNNSEGNFVAGEFDSIMEIKKVLNNVYARRKESRIDPMAPAIIDRLEYSVDSLLDYYEASLSSVVENDLICRLMLRMQELAVSDELNFEIYKEDIILALEGEHPFRFLREEDFRVFGMSLQEAQEIENLYGIEGLIHKISNITFTDIN